MRFWRNFTGFALATHVAANLKRFQLTKRVRVPRIRRPVLAVVTGPAWRVSNGATGLWQCGSYLL